MIVKYSSSENFDIPLAVVEYLAEEDTPNYGNYVMHSFDPYDFGQTASDRHY